MSVDSQYSGPIQALEELEMKLVEEDREIRWAFNKQVTARTIENRQGSYSIVKVFLPKGAEFPKHVHGETEFLLVTEGSAVYAAGDSPDKMKIIRELKRGGCVKVNPGRVHEMRAIEDTWLIAVTIPDSEAFAK